MTEEIIIDGVNVAGCDAYKDKHCMDKTSIMFCNLNICSNFPNCYYKQLKRLEQENERLKKELDLQQKINLKQQDITRDYWEALEEIGKIAGGAIDIITENDELLNYIGCIYNKIDEVLKKD